MRFQLRWTDQAGIERQPLLNTPVAVGREFNLMPSVISGEQASRIVLADAEVDPYHAALEDRDGELWIVDQGSRTGSKVNGIAQPYSRLQDGDRLQIGPFQIEVYLNLSAEPPPEGSSGMEVESPVMASGSAGGNAAAGFAAGMAGWQPPAGGNDPSSSMPPEIGPDGTCDRQVGFLFKRRCGRTTAAGCTYCQNGRVEQDPYFYDYDLYPGYGQYSRGYWGHAYYANRDRYTYNSETRRMDFTEADAASLEEEADTDYELDMGAS